MVAFYFYLWFASQLWSGLDGRGLVLLLRMIAEIVELGLY